jgi:hypothetical protein
MAARRRSANKSKIASDGSASASIQEREKSANY